MVVLPFFNFFKKKKLLEEKAVKLLNQDEEKLKFLYDFFNLYFQKAKLVKKRTSAIEKAFSTDPYFKELSFSHAGLSGFYLILESFRRELEGKLGIQREYIIPQFTGELINQIKAIHSKYSDTKDIIAEIGKKYPKLKPEELLPQEILGETKPAAAAAAAAAFSFPLIEEMIDYLISIVQSKERKVFLDEKKKIETDFFPLYMKLEHFITTHETPIVNKKYTTEELRDELNSKYNVQIFPKEFSILLSVKESDNVVYCLLLLRRILKSLRTKIKPATLQKIINEVTAGEITEDIFVTERDVVMLDLENQLLNIPIQYHGLVINNLNELFLRLQGADKSLIAKAFLSMVNDFGKIPQFSELVRVLPNQFLIEEKRALLAPHAAAAAKVISQFPAFKGYEKRIEEINRLPLAEQAAAFFKLYLEFEDLIRAGRIGNLTINEIRKHVKNNVDINELERRFQIALMYKRDQLVALTQEFSKKLGKELEIPKVEGKNIVSALRDALAPAYDENPDPQRFNHTFQEFRGTYGDLAYGILPVVEGQLTPEMKSTISLECQKELAVNIKDAASDSTVELPAFNAKNAKDSFEDFYNGLRDRMGTAKAKQIFVESYEKTKEKFGNSSLVLNVLSLVPSGLLEIEKMKLMTRGELEKLSKKTKQVDILKDEFMNIAAHELKTPLIPIIGYMSSILEDESIKLPKGVRKKLEISLRAARREQALVGDILDISKIEAGTMKYEMRRLDAARVFRDCVAGFRPMVKRTKIRLISKIPRNLPTIQGDEKRLLQVLANLISNALKFTEKGSVTVQAKATATHVVVSVRDTGIGIDQKSIPKLFKKFSQVDTSAKRRGEGTGLGLAISKGIIESHGGKIECESKAGKGSTFTFTLPLLKKQRRKK